MSSIEVNQDVTKSEDGNGGVGPLVSTNPLTTIANFLERYRSFVVSYPQLVLEIESAFRWISYLSTVGKWKNAELISELLYSTSNLLQLLNDGILRKAANIQLNAVSILRNFLVSWFTCLFLKNPFVEHLQTLLAVLEYTEVFSEFTARRLYGDVTRWTVIAAIQVSKYIFHDQ